MNLENWSSNGWLKPHQTSRQEIQKLLNLIRRDLKDSQSTDISADWRFAIAYNAALTCCQIALYCRGYEVARGQSEHYRIIQSLTMTIGEELAPVKTYLNACRNKRNIADYESAGSVSAAEVAELITVASDLFTKISNWLTANYPEMA
ncbi:MAG: hypothetical protein M0R34_08445 [Candidatus Marinimicrobia bacterium]|jgi:uncharacterized protein (UPF0332 family)|nr:hypothetical protein [Candidatus Neomarinimicrobiota bacterium]